jgi:murein DD-endopeptidase MepM/ murein hydrolase activator NlpD
MHEPVSGRPGDNQLSDALKKKNNIIIVLVIALVGTWAYLLWDKNQSRDTIELQAVQIENLDADKAAIQKEFEQAVVRLDSVTNSNSTLTNQVAQQQRDIDSQKAAIKKILNDRNATRASLTQARGMVSDLNGKIAALENQIALLKQENIALNDANMTLQGEKQGLEQDLSKSAAQNAALAKTVEIGSTFSASSIQISSIDVRPSGKEKITANSKRVDKLLVRFDVENRIAPSGPADMYLIVTDPAGKVITEKGFVLPTREEGDKPYTALIPVNYEKGTRQKVEFPIRAGQYNKGTYRLEIYHNGFKIGERNCPLK